MLLLRLGREGAVKEIVLRAEECEVCVCGGACKWRGVLCCQGRSEVCEEREW